MKAFMLERHGGPEILQIRDTSAPMPGYGEVRVKIHVIGINYPEALSRAGLYGWVPPLPYILGMEAYGEIDLLGEGVSGRSIGEPVIVGTQFGTYAEYICVPSRLAVPAVESLSAEENAALAVNYLTAWVGLTEMARLRPSDVVLVTAAAGGVGSAVVQISKSYGAAVIGAASSSKQEVLKKLGVDLALDYTNPDWVSGLIDFTHGRGVQVVFELVGGIVYQSALSVLAPMGRIVVAGISGVRPKGRNFFSKLGSLRKIPKINLLNMLSQSYAVSSFHVGRLLLEQRALDPIIADLMNFVKDKKIKPLVGRVYDFEDIPEAHKELEARKNTGKLVAKLI